MQNPLKIYYNLIILLYSFNLNVQINSDPPSNITDTIDINIKYREGKILLGLNRYFYLDTEFNDTETNYFDSSDIEEKTTFNTPLDYPYSYKQPCRAGCRLWKPKNDTLKLICYVSGNFNSEWDVKLQNTSFTYKTYQININPPSSSDESFYLKYLYSAYPFLYSEEQIIKIEENKKTYELIFKMGEYDGSILLILFSNNGYLFLDKCFSGGNILKCLIEKEELEEFLQYNNQIFNLYLYRPSNGFIYFNLVYNITINDDTKIKQDLYVGITRLFQEAIDRNNYIAYETNITSISNLISDKFQIELEEENATCYFKKDANNPLLILCKWNYKNDVNTKLGKIKNEIVANNSYIKYNFRIQPFDNNETFWFFDTGVIPYFVYPKVLDFNLNEQFTIIYAVKDDLSAVKLNPNINNLNCHYQGYFYSGDYNILECNINRTYFKNDKTEYYNTYQKLHYTS